jgi:two-component system, NarL family, response regulator NreC
MPCRILLAHSHEIVRLGLRVILEANRNVSICGEAADGLDAIRQAQQLRPDIVIADYNIPKANGFIVSRRILRRRAEQKLLIMDVVESTIVVRRLIRAGVRALISMSEPASVFVNAIDALQRNRPCFPPFVERLLLEQYLSPGRVAAPDTCDDCLSLRQQEVVQLLAEGRSTKEVAAVLGLSTKTAETHRCAILHKLQLHNIAQLTRYAVSQHIVTVARPPQPITMPATEGPERLVNQNAKALTIAA